MTWLRTAVADCEMWQGDGGDESRRAFLWDAAHETWRHIRLLEAALFIAYRLGWTRHQTRALRRDLMERRRHAETLYRVRCSFAKPGTVFHRYVQMRHGF